MRTSFYSPALCSNPQHETLAVNLGPPPPIPRAPSSPPNRTQSFPPSSYVCECSHGNCRNACLATGFILLLKKGWEGAKSGGKGLGWGGGGFLRGPYEDGALGK